MVYIIICLIWDRNLSPFQNPFVGAGGHNVMQMLAFRRWAINIIMNYCGSVGTGWFASPGLCLQHACTRQPASAPLWPWNLQAVTRTCLTQTGSSLTCNLFFTICAAKFVIQMLHVRRGIHDGTFLPARVHVSPSPPLES